ncbi:MAG: ABC transporter ATP-binding protein, partial [Syntrophaceae bacterium]|nr:ABC transporter ATP-binding protein [Syntrophaceae bacterium]
KGIIEPQAGRVKFDSFSPFLSHNIGYLGGDPDNSFVGITVQEEIVFGLENIGLSMSEIAERLDWALDLTELRGYENRLTYTLSGGEQQKLALAAVLAMDLKILLLDDALAMMDSLSRSKHWTWINGLKGRLGLTILFTTGKLEELNTADRILFLEKNQHGFIFDGKTADFLSSRLVDEWIELENGSEKFLRSLGKPFLVEKTKRLTTD